MNTGQRAKIGGETYKMVLLKIMSTNVRGVPMMLHLVEDEQTIEINEGDAFMTAFVPEKMLEGEL